MARLGFTGCEVGSNTDSFSSYQHGVGAKTGSPATGVAHWRGNGGSGQLIHTTDTTAFPTLGEFYLTFWIRFLKLPTLNDRWLFYASQNFGSGRTGLRVHADGTIEALMLGLGGTVTFGTVGVIGSSISLNEWHRFDIYAKRNTISVQPIPNPPYDSNAVFTVSVDGVQTLNFTTTPVALSEGIFNWATTRWAQFFVGPEGGTNPITGMWTDMDDVYIDSTTPCPADYAVISTYPYDRGTSWGWNNDTTVIKYASCLPFLAAANSIPGVRSNVTSDVIGYLLRTFRSQGATGTSIGDPTMFVYASSFTGRLRVLLNGSPVYDNASLVFSTVTKLVLTGVSFDPDDVIEVEVTKDANTTARTLHYIFIQAEFTSFAVSPPESQDIRIERMSATIATANEALVPNPFSFTPDMVIVNRRDGNALPAFFHRAHRRASKFDSTGYITAFAIPYADADRIIVTNQGGQFPALTSGAVLDLVGIYDPSHRLIDTWQDIGFNTDVSTAGGSGITVPYPLNVEADFAIGGNALQTGAGAMYGRTAAHTGIESTLMNGTTIPVLTSGVMSTDILAGYRITQSTSHWGFGLNTAGFNATILAELVSYTGNGAASQTIPCAGAPIMALTMPTGGGTGARSSMLKTWGMAPSGSRVLSTATLNTSTGLLDFGANTFRVGSLANVSGTAYQGLLLYEGVDPFIIDSQVTQMVLQTMVPDTAGCPAPTDGESFCGAIEDPIIFASWQPGDGTTRWHAETALDDPDSYYGGWKDDRLLKVSEVRRSLSGNTHSLEVGNFDITLADEDYAIRTILSADPGKYWSQRPVELYAVTPTARTAGLEARKIATGFIDSDPVYDPEKTAMSVRLRMKDRLGVSQGWTPFGQQMVPRRLITQITLPGALPAVVGQAAPLPYGILTSSVAPSGIAPIPVVGANPIYGAFTDGIRWYAGYGSLGDGVVSASGVNVFVGAGGALPLGVPGDEYFVQVYAVASDGRIANPFPYSPFDASVTITPGNQTVDVSWLASPDAVKYYVYLGTGEPGIRWSQWLETGALAVSFNRGPTAGAPANYDNITLGARPAIEGQRWRYGIRSRVGSARSEVAEGMWGITNVQLPNGRFRPLLPSWENVPAADSYEMLRGSIGATTWDRRWIVPAGQFLPTLDFIYGTDDMRDTGVEYVGAESSRAAGAVACTYVGDEVLPDQQVWRRLLVAGCAVKGVTNWYFDPGGSGAVQIDESDGTEILFPRADDGGAWPSFFLNKFRDVIGTDGVTRRYTFGYARGVAGDLVASGTGKVSVNLEGIETFGTGNGTVITHLVDQFAHLLQNVVIVSGEGYTTGSWLPAPTLGPDGVCAISSEGFEDLKRFRDEELFAQTGVAEFAGAGIVGAFGRPITVSEELKRWCTCGDMRIGVNRHWQITLNALRGAGAVEAVPIEADEFDIHDRSLKIEPRISELANVFPYKYRRNYATDGWEVDNQTLTNEDSIARWQTRQEREPLELHYLRNDTIARHAVGFYNFRSSDVRSYVTFEGSLCLLDPEYDVGEYIRLRHWRGIGPSGWAGRPLWILSSTLNPDTRRVRLTCLEVDFLVPWEAP